MSVELRQSQNNARLRQYRALLEVAESIAAHRDLPSLLRDLAERLQLVVKFDGVNVVLYDAEHNLMRMNVLESPILSQAQLPTHLSVEEAPAGWVWQTQQPLLMADLDAYQSRYPRVVAELKQHNIKTIYVLPLTSAGRRLGALGFGSLQEQAWSEDDRNSCNRWRSWWPWRWTTPSTSSARVRLSSEWRANVIASSCYWRSTTPSFLTLI